MKSFVLASLLGLTSAAVLPRQTTTWWKPAAGDSWAIQLIEPLAPAKANSSFKIYDLDLFDNTAANITQLKKQGHKIICYFSAGTYEAWRDDADQFPEAALGGKMDDWDERWIDTRNTKVREIMTNRIKLAKTKGCDAVDPDNIDAFGNDENDISPALTEDTAIDYVTFLAKTAHDNSLAAGLKNGGAIVSEELVAKLDFEVNEQCVKYKECADLQPFIDAGKPVFHIEYSPKDKKPADASFITTSCTNAGAKGFSTLIKTMNLDSWYTLCPKTTK